MVQKFSGISVKAGKRKYLERYYRFFRKLSTGMNRSIWIRRGITENSIQMVSTPLRSSLQTFEGKRDCSQSIFTLLDAQTWAKNCTKKHILSASYTHPQASLPINQIGMRMFHSSCILFILDSSTLGARGFSRAVSGVGDVSIVTHAKNLWSRERFFWVNTPGKHWAKIRSWNTLKSMSLVCRNGEDNVYVTVEICFRFDYFFKHFDFIFLCFRLQY